MFVQYKRDLSHNYMLIQMEGDIPSDSYELRVLMTNRIPGILPIEFEEVNGSTFCRYDITSCQPFHVLCGSGRMTAEILRELFSNLLECLLSFEDYLLDPSHLLLDAESLFLKWEERTLMIPYVPCYSQDIHRSLVSLTESIIMQSSRGQEDCVVLACQILLELQKKDLQLAELQALLGQSADDAHSSPLEKPESFAASEDVIAKKQPQQEAPADLAKEPAAPSRNISGAIRTQIPERETVRMALIAAVPALLLYVLLQLQSFFLLSFAETAGASLLAAAALLLIQRILQKRKQEKPRKEEEWGLSDEYYEERANPLSGRSDPDQSEREIREQPRKEAVVPLYESRQSMDYSALFDDEEDHTTVLSGNPKTASNGSPALIPANPSEGLAPIPIEGRELLIGKQKTLVDAVIERDTISRIHARIFRKEDQYYLSDMGSKNGTSIDGRAVVGREEAPLTDGAKVTFSNITYVYREGGLI